MIILGIDPGLATLGFAFIKKTDHGPKLLDVGMISTAAGLPQATRLKEIHDDLTELIQEYKPNYSCVEQLFFSKNVTTGMTVAEARGVALLALEQAGVHITEMAPNVMKLALTGNGHADKKAVQKMLCLELGLESPPQPDDAADALALALSLSGQLR